MKRPRRVSNFPPAISARPNVMTIANLRPASRSESLLRAIRQHEHYLAPLEANMMDSLSWVPSNETARTTNCVGNRAPVLTMDSPLLTSESTQIGDDYNSVDGDEGVGTGQYASLAPLAEFQPETWWPAVKVNDIDIHGRDGGSGCFSQLVAVGDRSAVLASGNNDRPISPSSFAMDSPCFDVTNSVAVASVDFSDHPYSSATPEVVIAAQLAAAGPVGVELPRATSTGRGGKAPTSSASPSPTSDQLSGRRQRHLSVRNPINRPPSRRENHILSEKQRRQSMNFLFSTLQSLLPHPASKTDKASIVWEITEYIRYLQAKLEELTTQHHQQRRNAVIVSKAVTVVDHSSSSVTALITAHDPDDRGSPTSCLRSFHLGPNVVVTACGVNLFIAASSPRGRRGLFQQMLVTLRNYDLDAVNATISTSNLSVFHYLHCQVPPDVEVVDNAGLHSELQKVIDSFE